MLPQWTHSGSNCVRVRRISSSSATSCPSTSSVARLRFPPARWLVVGVAVVRVAVVDVGVGVVSVSVADVRGAIVGVDVAVVSVGVAVAGASVVGVAAVHGSREVGAGEACGDGGVYCVSDSYTISTSAAGEGTEELLRIPSKNRTSVSGGSGASSWHGRLGPG